MPSSAIHWIFVTFRVHAPLADSQNRVWLLGSLPELGEWKPASALMTGQVDGEWKVFQARVQLPSNSAFEWAWCHQNVEGSVSRWESSSRRQRDVSVYSGLLHTTWGDTTLEIFQQCVGSAELTTMRRTKRGDVVAAAGSTPPFGCWDPSKAPLADEFPPKSGRWSVKVFYDAESMQEWNWIIIGTKTKEVKLKEKLPTRFLLHPDAHSWIKIEAPWNKEGWVKEMSPREHGGGDEIHPGTVKMLHSRKARHAEIRHWIQRADLHKALASGVEITVPGTLTSTRQTPHPVVPRASRTADYGHVSQSLEQRIVSPESLPLSEASTPSPPEDSEMQYDADIQRLCLRKVSDCRVENFLPPGVENDWQRVLLIKPYTAEVANKHTAHHSTYFVQCSRSQRDEPNIIPSTASNSPDVRIAAITSTTTKNMRTEVAESIAKAPVSKMTDKRTLSKNGMELFEKDRSFPTRQQPSSEKQFIETGTKSFNLNTTIRKRKGSARKLDDKKRSSASSPSSPRLLKLDGSGLNADGNDNQDEISQACLMDENNAYQSPSSVSLTISYRSSKESLFSCGVVDIAKMGYTPDPNAPVNSKNGNRNVVSEPGKPGYSPDPSEFPANSPTIPSPLLASSGYVDHANRTFKQKTTSSQSDVSPKCLTSEMQTTTTTVSGPSKRSVATATRGSRVYKLQRTGFPIVNFTDKTSPFAAHLRQKDDVKEGGRHNLAINKGRLECGLAESIKQSISSNNAGNIGAASQLPKNVHHSNQALSRQVPKSMLQTTVFQDEPRNVNSASKKVTDNSQTLATPLTLQLPLSRSIGANAERTFSSEPVSNVQKKVTDDVTRVDQAISITNSRPVQESIRDAIKTDTSLKIAKMSRQTSTDHASSITTQTETSTLSTLTTAIASTTAQVSITPPSHKIITTSNLPNTTEQINSSNVCAILPSSTVDDCKKSYSNNFVKQSNIVVTCMEQKVAKSLPNVVLSLSTSIPYASRIVPKKAVEAERTKMLNIAITTTNACNSTTTAIGLTSITGRLVNDSNKNDINEMTALRKHVSKPDTAHASAAKKEQT